MASSGFHVPFPFHNTGWLAATKMVAQTRFQQFCLGGKPPEASLCVEIDKASAPGPEPTAYRIYRADGAETPGPGAPGWN